MMSLLTLPSPVVNCILSFLDAEDFVSYLSVVSPGHLDHLSPHTFRLARNFHGSAKDAEWLLRFARSSRHVLFFGSLLNLSVSRFARLVNQLALVRHLDLSGLVLAEGELAKFAPVAVRLESLKVRVVCRCGSRELPQLTTERGDDDPYAQLRRLHIVVDLRSTDLLCRLFLRNAAPRLPAVNLAACFLPAMRAKLRLRYFGLEVATVNGHSLEGPVDVVAFAQALVLPSAVEELFMTCQDTSVILSCFNIFSRATKVTLATQGLSLPDITRTIEAHLLKMPLHHPEIEPRVLPEGKMHRTLHFRPVRRLMEKKEASRARPECPMSFLFAAGNVVSSTLLWDERRPEWICHKSSSHTTIFELSSRNVFDDRVLSLAGVQELVVYLDEPEVAQQLVSLSAVNPRRLQPRRLRLIIREHIPADRRADVMDSLCCVLKHFTRLCELSILGFAFLPAKDLLHIFDLLFASLTRLQLIHYDFYAWMPNSSLVRLPQCIARLLRLRHLCIVCRKTCWDEQIISPDRLFPVLANMPCLHSLDVYVPHLTMIYGDEAAYHDLLSSERLNSVWLVVPDLSTPTSHLVVKRLRATVKQTNKATGRRLMFRISSSDNRTEARPAAIPYPNLPYVCHSPFPF